MTAGATGRQSL